MLSEIYHLHNLIDAIEQPIDNAHVGQLQLAPRAAQLLPQEPVELLARRAVGGAADAPDDGEDEQVHVHVVQLLELLRSGLSSFRITVRRKREPVGAPSASTTGVGRLSFKESSAGQAAEPLAVVILELDAAGLNLTQVGQCLCGE